MIRHVLGAFGEALRLPDDLVEDLRLAVTEACTNVVRHAYPPDDPGPVEISIQPSDELVSVVVSDHGRGIGASADTTGPGLGLPLIAAIVDAVELQPAPGRWQPRGDDVRPAPPGGRRVTSPPIGVDAPTTVSIAAGPLVGPILRRVVGHARRARRPAARSPRRRRCWSPT